MTDLCCPCCLVRVDRANCGPVMFLSRLWSSEAEARDPFISYRGYPYREYLELQRDEMKDELANLLDRLAMYGCESNWESNDLNRRLKEYDSDGIDKKVREVRFNFMNHCICEEGPSDESEKIMFSCNTEGCDVCIQLMRCGLTRSCGALMLVEESCPNKRCPYGWGTNGMSNAMHANPYCGACCCKTPGRRCSFCNRGVGNERGCGCNKCIYPCERCGKNLCQIWEPQGCSGPGGWVKLCCECDPPGEDDWY